MADPNPHNDEQNTVFGTSYTVREFWITHRAVAFTAFMLKMQVVR